MELRARSVDLSTPEPPLPTFDETLESVAARLRTQIGTVRRTRDLEAAHPRIQKLLDADEQRRARQAESRYPTFDDPVFETNFEKRRLRVLNSLLRALDRLNVNVSIDGREARTLVAHVGDFSVGFTIDGVSVKTASTQPKGVSGPMRCQLMALCGGDQPIETWTDAEGQPLETRLGKGFRPGNPSPTSVYRRDIDSYVQMGRLVYGAVSSAPIHSQPICSESRESWPFHWSLSQAACVPLDRERAVSRMVPHAKPEAMRCL